MRSYTPKEVIKILEQKEYPNRNNKKHRKTVRNKILLEED